MRSRSVALLLMVFLWSNPVRGGQRGGQQRGVAVPVEVLKAYAGNYRVGPAVKLEIVLAGDHLTASFGGSEALPLSGLSGTIFRVIGVGVDAEFIKGETGAATHVVLRQNGEEVRAPRIPEKIVVQVPSEILKRYVGKYTRRPGFDILITLDGDRLMGESTGQFKHPLFAESETSFFFKDVEAEIEFAKDANGVIDHLVLHRFSVRETAKRR